MGVASIPMMGRSSNECAQLAAALCIVLNGYRRQEIALRLACDDVVNDFQYPGGRRAAAKVRDYLEAADRGLDYQGLIDMRESQEDTDGL